MRLTENVKGVLKAKNQSVVFVLLVLFQTVKFGTLIIPDAPYARVVFT